MSDAFHNCLTEITSVASVMAAVFSSLCAWFSFKLAAKIRNEMKSDEILIVSKLEHPRLANEEHAYCVLTCLLFNKSKRKSYIRKITAYDRRNLPMAITWSNQIDDHGNPVNPRELIGILDTERLCLRENMGKEIEYCRLEIQHSFSPDPTIAIYDPLNREELK